MGYCVFVCVVHGGWGVGKGESGGDGRCLHARLCVCAHGYVPMIHQTDTVDAEIRSTQRFQLLSLF